MEQNENDGVVRATGVPELACGCLNDECGRTFRAAPGAAIKCPFCQSQSCYVITDSRPVDPEENV